MTVRFASDEPFLPDEALRVTESPRRLVPLACGTITVLMDKGQKRFSAVGRLLSSPYASLVSRDVGLLALGLHVALAPTGRFSADALLRRGCSEESSQT